MIPDPNLKALGFYEIAAKLIAYELTPRLKRLGIEIHDSPITPKQLSLMALLKANGLASTHDIRRAMDNLLKNPPAGVNNLPRAVS